MRIAITDACIFLDLISIEVASEFFNLGLEVHTVQDVLNELHPQQQDVLSRYRHTGKLTVHNISERDQKIIHQTAFPKGLSNCEKAAIHLAIQLNATLISSDKVVRSYARALAIEYHGILWILDRLVESQLLSKVEAAEKLKTIVATDFAYQSNTNIHQEIKSRLQQWADV